MPKLINTKLYDLAPEFWNVTLFSLISLAFILSDWIILYSSFGDFILAFTVFLFVILGQFTLTRKQIIFGSIPIIFLALNYILNVNFNDYWFDTTRALRSYLKISLYVLVILLVFSLVNREKLMKRFLAVSNVFAITTIIIGIVITLLIYLNREDVYNIAWTFTRTDTTSYLFNGNPNIVRTRSLFSEPAHLGYYLNTIFFANIFSTIKRNYWVLGALVIGILLTLSYSMIIILIATGITYFLSQLVKGEFKWQQWYGFAFIPFIIGIVYFWEFIDTAIIQRTLDIITGTDGSAYNRIFESWIYLENERIIFGNGIAHSPPITNIYAYLLTDFGLVGLIPYVIFTFYLLFMNVSVFVMFVLMNSAKGGYLNPAFWMFLLYVFVCYTVSFKKRRRRNQIL
ncbi:MAG: hypothetical protein JJU16_03480 [Alkalibacterium sp.]|nr:hypothetical protein [Alkalibacterium sp.]